MLSADGLEEGVLDAWGFLYLLGGRHSGEGELLGMSFMWDEALVEIR